MFDKAKGFLGGYMTYLVAISGILGAVIAWQQGAITTEDMVKTVWGGVLAMFARRAISNAKKPD